MEVNPCMRNTFRNQKKVHLFLAYLFDASDLRRYSLQEKKITH